MSETKELRIAMALLLNVSECNGGVQMERRDNSRDTSVGVDLLEDLVDVRRVWLDPLLGSLLSALGLGSRGLSSLESV
jgi:hypothetical protein